MKIWVISVIYWSFQYWIFQITYTEFYWIFSDFYWIYQPRFQWFECLNTCISILFSGFNEHSSGLNVWIHVFQFYSVDLMNIPVVWIQADFVKRFLFCRPTVEQPLDVIGSPKFHTFWNRTPPGCRTFVHHQNSRPDEDTACVPVKYWEVLLDFSIYWNSMHSVSHWNSQPIFFHSCWLKFTQFYSNNWNLKHYFN